MPRKKKYRFNRSAEDHRASTGEFQRKIDYKRGSPDVELATQYIGRQMPNFTSKTGVFIAAILFLNLGVGLVEASRSTSKSKKDFDDKEFRDQLKSSIDPLMPKEDKALIMRAAKIMPQTEKAGLLTCLTHINTGKRKAIVSKALDPNHYAMFDLCQRRSKLNHFRRLKVSHFG